MCQRTLIPCYRYSGFSSLFLSFGFFDHLLQAWVRVQVFLDHVDFLIWIWVAVASIMSLNIRFLFLHSCTFW